MYLHYIKRDMKLLERNKLYKNKSNVKFQDIVSTNEVMVMLQSNKHFRKISAFFVSVVSLPDYLLNSNFNNLRRNMYFK